MLEKRGFASEHGRTFNTWRCGVWPSMPTPFAFMSQMRKEPSTELVMKCSSFSGTQHPPVSGAVWPFVCTKSRTYLARTPC